MSNNVIDSQIISLVGEIINEINEKNIDIYNLCEKLYISTDQFIDLIKKPISQLSIYFEILDVIEAM